MTRFMLDVETTGLDLKTDEVLEIGIVEMLRGRVPGQWLPGRRLGLILHTERRPQNLFAKEFMSGLYALSNAAPRRSPCEVRSIITGFLAECGASGQDVDFCGVNLCLLDIPMLVSHGYLVAPGSADIDGKQVRVGDFNYRTLDLNSVAAFIADKYGTDLVTIRKLANRLSCTPNNSADAHRALSDCLFQIETLNGLGKITRLKLASFLFLKKARRVLARHSTRK